MSINGFLVYMYNVAYDCETWSYMCMLNGNFIAFEDKERETVPNSILKDLILLLFRVLSAGSLIN